MPVDDTPKPPQLPSPRRGERRRARLEDFEMIERVRAALGLLESKWSVPVIILLASGVRRHAWLLDNTPGLSKKVLTSTLRRLQRNGIVSRHVYADVPVRVEYTLTQLGWQLTEPLMAMYEWALEHESQLPGLAEAEEAPRRAPTPVPVPAAPVFAVASAA
jgi:DNA-binding HxlR family transcriptional regulator